MRHGFVCPLCGDIIEGLEPAESPGVGGPSLQAAITAKIDQVQAANEELLRYHFSSEHTMDEAMLALGVARSALMDIVNLVTEQTGRLNDAIHERAEHGLGHK